MYEVTQNNGERWNTARAFLDDHMDRPNLTVITHAMAQKVILENGRAAGVEVKVKGKPQTVTAKREPNAKLSSQAGLSDHLSSCCSQVSALRIN